MLLSHGYSQSSHVPATLTPKLVGFENAKPATESAKAGTMETHLRKNMFNIFCLNLDS